MNSRPENQSGQAWTRQRFDENEDGNDYRRKRSCQRLHRNKTPKDESWEELSVETDRHNPKD